MKINNPFTIGVATLLLSAVVASAENQAGSNDISQVKAPAPAASTPATSVVLKSFFNANGICKDEVEFTGGLDDLGNALSGNLLSSNQTWNGTPFTIGPTNASNVVTCAGQIIPLTPGMFSSLRMLATAVNGSQETQAFTITYSDSSTQLCTQGISDWFTPESYQGESKAVNLSYRNQSDGTKDEQPFYVYGYSFSLNKTNAVKSVTLPNNSNVKIIALTLVP
jgi:hypothetical protein